MKITGWVLWALIFLSACSRVRKPIETEESSPRGVLESTLAGGQREASPVKATQTDLWVSPPHSAIASPEMPGTLAWEFPTARSSEQGGDDSHFMNRVLKYSHKPWSSWKFRIGNGGQVYSIENPLHGALITKEIQQDSNWVDRVLQFVGVNLSLNLPDSGFFIHQAGTYSHGQTKEQFYSPVLDSSLTPNGYRILAWPQQAHVHQPRMGHRSDILLQTEYVNLGWGLIRVTYVVHNYGTVPLDHFNIPWLATNNSSLPQSALSKDGGWIWQTQANWSDRIIPYRSVDGWVAHLNQSKLGLGIIFGHDTQDAPGTLRYGKGRNQDLTITTAIRRPIINSGETAYFRYYLMFNHINNIHRTAKHLTRRPNRFFGRITFSPKDVSLKENCIASLGDTNCLSFATLNRPIEGTHPVFALRDSKGLTRIVTSPYDLGSDFESYSRLSHLSFLGWGLVNPVDSIERRAAIRLSEILPSQLFDPSRSKNLYVISRRDPPNDILAHRRLTAFERVVNDGRPASCFADTHLNVQEFIYKKAFSPAHFGIIELRAIVVRSLDNRFGKNRPTLVAFHGGGLADGSPTYWLPELYYFASRGMTAISFQYRLKLTSQSTPAMSLEDATSAIEWLNLHARELSVDTERVVTAGDSAGAFLALAPALRSDLKIRASMVFYPLLDREAIDPPGPTKINLSELGERLPPLLVVHGGRDTHPRTPIETSQKLCFSMKGRCTGSWLPTWGHAFLSSPAGYQIGVTLMDRFLIRQGILFGDETHVPDWVSHARPACQMDPRKIVYLQSRMDSLRKH